MTYGQITLEERSMIAGYRQSKYSLTKIGKELGRHKSTISRELKRNTGERGYRPKQANEKSISRKTSSPKVKKFTSVVKKNIIKLLKKEMSPVQISEYLKINKHEYVSHQRIYQFIDLDKQNGGYLYTYLRQGNNRRRKKYGKNTNKRGVIKNRVSIKERPLHVESRMQLGHWEGDTIIGKNHKMAMITLVERKTGFSIIEKVKNKSSEIVARNIISAMSKHGRKVKTITFDNGLEFAGHESIAKALKCKIYFADPYSSWQRGTNENTNGLIRQYFPKGSNFKTYSNSLIRKITDKLNKRPRKRLDFKSPYEIFYNQSVALIG